MQQKQGRITAWLAAAPSPLFTIYAIIAAFSTYFCMYAFRKPFSAAKYEGLMFVGLELKTVFVISQLLGYTLSKYIGTKVCSEVKRGQRMILLIAMIAIAEGALLLFGLLPGNWKILAIFLNGLPLGMIWGLVVWYLEGRRTSELLLAGLSVSFIIASGIVKDIGKALMGGQESLTFFALDLPEPVGLVQLMAPNPFASFGEISQFWMPFLTGVIFLLPFLVSVFFLNQIPNPSALDEKMRMHREPMTGAERIAWLKRFLPGLAMLFIVYFFLTAFRDYRDNFGAEIFGELGYDEAPGIFSRSETWVAFGVITPLAFLFLIKNNRWGLLGAFLIMGTGTALLGLGTMLFDAGQITGLQWMIMIGLGSYLAYVPFGSVLFDRLMATTRTVGTAVFAIYVADALGYTGSVGVRLYKDLAESRMSDLDFMRLFSYSLAVLASVLFVASAVYFLTRAVPADEPQGIENA